MNFVLLLHLNPLARQNKKVQGKIIDAALNLTRKGGISALTARALGTELGSSSRPVFGLFKNMEEVQQEVFKAADTLYQGYIKDGMESGKYPLYKAIGTGMQTQLSILV